MEKYLIVSIVLVVLSVIYLKIADYFNIIDKPNNRSSHTVPTIRGGGVLFLMAVWIFFIQSSYQYPYLVCGITLISIVSFIDDLKTLSSKVRLPFQFIAVLLAMQEIQLLVLPWWGIILITIIGVGFINFYNFMDGINGITGAYSLSVLLGMYLINEKVHLIHSDLLLYVAISLVVFGYYNFRKKARFFAGDIGSISIAVVLFYMGAVFVYKLQAPIILLLIIVYATDAILTILYRKIIGEKIMEPHRHHIYQKLVDVKKMPHMYVALSYAFLQGLINIVVYLYVEAAIEKQLLILLGVIVLFILFYVFLFRVLGGLKKKQERLASGF